MSDQLPPLPDDVRALLDAAEPPAPSGAFEAKVLAKLSATLGLLPPGGGPSSGGPSSGGPSSGGPSSGGASSGGASSGGASSGASGTGASASGASASGAASGASVTGASASGAASGGAASGASASGVAGGLAGAGGAVLLTKTTLALGSALLLAAGVAGGVVLGRTVWSPEPLVVQAPPVVTPPTPELPPKVEAPPEPPPRVETPEPPPSEPAKPVVAKPSRPVEVTPPKEPTPPASRDTQLSQERGLLEVARTALAKGDVAGTLDAVERHAREFPHGRLAEEREVLFIQALVQADRKDEAARHAEVFRKQFPDSLMSPAVDAALGQ